MSLLNDISRCASNSCAQNSECLRYTDKPAGGRWPIADFAPSMASEPCTYILRDTEVGQ